MTDSKTLQYPPLYWRLYSVWYRHLRVYTRNMLSNAFPPFVEPFIFLVGVGLGLGNYITEPIGGVRYIEFLGAGLLVTTAMFTSAFECTGEMLWAGTKGLFFSFAVLCVLSAFKIVALPYGLLAPLVGFLTGVMFAALSLLVTSFVKTINHFNFYFTGFISPIFFFSGVVFPIENLPGIVQPIAEIVPLTHSVRLVRSVCLNDYKPVLLLDLLYIAIFILVVGYFAIRRLKKRLVN